MKRTALILAGAAAFDLGVMAVAAHAHSGTQDPPGRTDDFVNQGLITNSNSKLVGQVGSTRPPVDSAAPGSTSGAAAVWDPTGTGGCTPGGPLSSGTANPCAPGAISGERDFYLRLDRVNTVQACTTRGGQVVPHEGVQQCRITGPTAPAAGIPPPPRPRWLPRRN